MTNQRMAALFKTLTTGVYVVGVVQGERRNAFTAAWVGQVSFNPLLLAISVNPNNVSYPLIKAGRVFAVSVLEQGQIDLARHFGAHSGREQDKLAGHAWRTRVTNAPILSDALAWFDCRLQSTWPAGDHELIVGRVIAGAIERPDAAPMLYAQTGNLDGSSALYPSKF